MSVVHHRQESGERKAQDDVLNDYLGVLVSPYAGGVKLFPFYFSGNSGGVILITFLKDLSSCRGVRPLAECVSGSEIRTREHSQTLSPRDEFRKR